MCPAHKSHQSVCTVYKAVTAVSPRHGLQSAVALNCSTLQHPLTRPTHAMPLPMSMCGCQAAKSVGKTLKAFQPTIREVVSVSQDIKGTLEKELGLDEIRDAARPPQRMLQQPSASMDPAQPSGELHVSVLWGSMELWGLMWWAAMGGVGVYKRVCVQEVRVEDYFCSSRASKGAPQQSGELHALEQGMVCVPAGKGCTCFADKWHVQRTLLEELGLGSEMCEAAWHHACHSSRQHP